jgi:hypothetical protein
MDSVVFRQCNQCGQCVKRVALATDLERAFAEKQCADFQTIEWRAQRLKSLFDALPIGKSSALYGVNWISKEEYDESGPMVMSRRHRCF